MLLYTLYVISMSLSVSSLHRFNTGNRIYHNDSVIYKQTCAPVCMRVLLSTKYLRGAINLLSAKCISLAIIKCRKCHKHLTKFANESKMGEAHTCIHMRFL